jgi:hypothetical protein
MDIRDQMGGTGILRWFRMYSEILDDPKVARMTDSQFRIFTYLLAVASECDREGCIQLTVKDLAWRMRCPEDKLSDALEHLCEAGIIAKHENEFQVVNWRKRQFRSDNVTGRTKRFRERSGERSSEPPMERLRERHQSRADTEADTEQSRGDHPVDNSAESACSEKPDKNGAEEVKALLEKIATLMPGAWFFQEVALFTQSSIPRINRGEIHQEALLHTLRRLAEELGNGETILRPKAFLKKIMEAENGHYQEQEEQLRKERLQPSREEAITALQRIGGVLRSNEQSRTDD